MPVTENTPRLTGAEIGLDDVDARQACRQTNLAAQATDLETETDRLSDVSDVTVDTAVDRASGASADV